MNIKICSHQTSILPILPKVRPIFTKIEQVVARVVEAFLFPARYFGGKSWSLVGLAFRLVTGQVLFDMMRNNKSFSAACFGASTIMQRLTQPQALESVKYLASVNYIHAGKAHWIDGVLTPHASHAVDASNNSGDFFYNKALGLKVAVLESKENEILITFGAHDSLNEFLSDEKDKKKACGGQKLAIVGNYGGLVPAIYQKALELVLELKNEPRLQNKKFVLVGQSFGGSLAQYVAFKTSLEAVCINSVPLGPGLQWDIGARNLEKSDHVRHISVETDYVSDNRMLEPIDRIATHLLGFKMPGNFGRRYSIPSAYTKSSQTHSLPIGSLMKYLGHSIYAKPQILYNKL
jgi:hypothetical protein